MRWPWGKTEKRQAGGGFSDALVAAIVARAGGASVGEPGAIAALETAAGLWARGFASAELDPPIAAVTPSFLASVARQLVRRGESLWAIDVRRGEIVLTPAGSWDIAGAADPASWVYRLDMFGPSGNETRIYPAESVCHFKYATDPERPWHGISPLGYSRQTARLAANLELRLAEEAGSRVGYLLPVPSDGGDGSADDPLASLKNDLGSLQGNTALIETTSAGLRRGPGRCAAIGLEGATNGGESARNAGGASARCGRGRAGGLRRPAWASVRPIRRHVPAREWRRFSVGTLQPAARCVAEELAFKLDVPGLRIHF